MKQERCVLPVKCKHCGAIFDLWYDLQAQEQLRQMSPGQVSLALSKRTGMLLAQQSHCWDCRKEALFGETGLEDDIEENIELSGYDFSGV